MSEELDYLGRLGIVSSESSRTLGQIAFEADRENAIRENQGVERLIPTWQDASPSVKRNWELLAARIATALARDAGNEIKAMRGEVVDVTVEANAIRSCSE